MTNTTQPAKATANPKVKKPAKSETEAAKVAAAAAKAAADLALKEAKAVATKTAREAEKVAKKAAADKKREKARAAKIGARKAKHETAYKKLKPIATEINVRMEKAVQMDGKADDHRLAAALRLAEARTVCEAAGLKFKTWVLESIDENIGGWENARKLATVGAAPEPVKALENMRHRNKEANRKAREAKKAQAAGQLPAPDGKPAAKALTPKVAATQAIAAMPEENQRAFIRDRAKVAGLHVVDPAVPMGIGKLRAEFDKLKATEKMEFAKYAVKAIGGTLTLDLDEPAPRKASTPDPDMPESLRRT